MLVYAYALEKEHPEEARRARRRAHAFGEIANLLGDDATLDFRSEADHRRLQANLAQWGEAVRCLDRQALPTPELNRATDKLFQDYLR